MSTDMFPQGFLDLVENARWYLIHPDGRIIGPYDSCLDADEDRKSMFYPNEWSFRREVGEVSE